MGVQKNAANGEKSGENPRIGDLKISEQEFTSLGVPPPGVKVGVGPWVEEFGGLSEGLPGDLPSGDQYDPELLHNGDTRNVVDKYRYWTTDAIVADLDQRRSPLHIAIENLEHDFNIGSIVRTGNAFNVASVHIVGRRRWNRRGAMVTDKYLHVHHHNTPDEMADWFVNEFGHNGVAIWGVDNIDGAQPIETSAMPTPLCLLFGQESTGLSDAAQAICERLIYISQFGSTRSMNVGAAAAITMHNWVVQHYDKLQG